MPRQRIPKSPPRQFVLNPPQRKKKVKEIDVDNFVIVKGWKSIGNKVNYYKRMSAFEILRKITDIENSNIENILEGDNNNSDTLNLFE